MLGRLNVWGWLVLKCPAHLSPSHIVPVSSLWVSPLDEACVSASQHVEREIQSWKVQKFCGSETTTKITFYLFTFWTIFKLYSSNQKKEKINTSEIIKTPLSDIDCLKKKKKKKHSLRIDKGLSEYRNGSHTQTKRSMTFQVIHYLLYKYK